jgi:3-hydroxy acid dehydrogenase / malonic semialdehyde reductase
MKTALITGASSGIGLACANELIDDFILILCSRDLKKLEEIKKNLSVKGRVYIFKTDVRLGCDVKNLFSQIKKLKLSVDVVINSAGLALDLNDLEKGLTYDWDSMIDTNIKGLLMVSKYSLEIMIKKNQGSIINIGSISGINSYSKGVVYSATKAAVKSISDGMRKELIKSKIKITNIQPGLVETNFSKIRFKGNQKKASSVYEGIIPLQAGDISNIIRYVIDLPEHVQINEITVTPVHQATVEVIHRDI